MSFLNLTDLDAESTRVEIDDDSEEESSEDIPNNLLRSESLYELPTALLKRLVSTPYGKKVEFGSLVLNSTVLFIFIRHFGWYYNNYIYSIYSITNDILAVFLVAVTHAN